MTVNNPKAGRNNPKAGRKEVVGRNAEHDQSELCEILDIQTEHERFVSVVQAKCICVRPCAFPFLRLVWNDGIGDGRSASARDFRNR